MARRELVLLVLILLAGSGLRVFALSRSAVEHFDEGVYASNLWFGPPDYAYPMRQLYAPPLLPALIETGMIAGLPPNLAALLPGTLAGCATIAALWWFGRTWFSPSVGLSAATLCAFSDFHIAYSAAALTDVLLGLWLVLAVQAIGLSLWRGDLRWAVAGGVLTGLAWWTKYNGWLPLAIGGAALPLVLFTAKWAKVKPSDDARPLPSFRMQGTCLAATALTAAIVWAPYVLSLQTSGGYSPIATNHARYVVGLSGWPDSLWRHTASQQGIEGPLSWLSVALATALTSVIAREGRSKGRSLGLMIVASIAALVLAAVGTSFVLVVVAAPLGLVAGLASMRQVRETDCPTSRRHIGLALVAAWYGGLALATPCYWPYPRLLVPWLLAAWLGAAVLIDELARRVRFAAESPRAAWRFPLATALLLGLAALAALYHHPRFAHWFPPRNSRLNLFLASQLLRADLHPSSDPRVIYVFGEPATFFQLKAAGEPLVVPIQTIPTDSALDGGQPIATYLVLGPHSQGDPDFQGSWHTRQKPPWDLVGSYEYEPSPIVYLDLYDPRQYPLGNLERDQLKLYRLSSGR